MTDTSAGEETWLHLPGASSGTYLVIVQVVGQTSYKEFVGGIRNDRGHDACRDDDRHLLYFRKRRVVNVAARGDSPGTWKAGCSEIPGKGR